MLWVCPFSHGTAAAACGCLPHFPKDMGAGWLGLQMHLVGRRDFPCASDLRMDAEMVFPRRTLPTLMLSWFFHGSPMDPQ